MRIHVKGSSVDSTVNLPNLKTVPDCVVAYDDNGRPMVFQRDHSDMPQPGVDTMHHFNQCRTVVELLNYDDKDN